MGSVSLCDFSFAEFNTTFIMHNEDHTLGNALRMMLNQNPKVCVMQRTCGGKQGVRHRPVKQPAPQRLHLHDGCHLPIYN